MDESKNAQSEKHYQEEFIEEEEEEEIYEEGDDFPQESPVSLNIEEEEINEESPILIDDEDDDIDDELYHLKNIESTFKTFMYGVDCILLPSRKYEVKIPRTFLPVTFQYSYGFMQHDIAINVDVYPTDGWNNPYSKAIASHPITGPNFTGSILVRDTITKFFKDNYQPKTYYRSAPYFFSCSRNAESSKVALLIKKGFTELQSKRALSLCNNDIDESIQFLQTGQLNMSEHLEDCKPPISYRENPLIYLVLEISDSVYDVQNHCSICHEIISPGIKPSTCEKESCKFSFIEIGVGTSLVQEIKRDLFVADLLVTTFLSALQMNFLTPAPPNYTIKQIQNISKHFPPMSKIAQFDDDVSLCDTYGKDMVNLLRWIILSNRSQLFYLEKKIEIKSLASPKTFQFMALLSTPDQEEIFQQLKRKYGSFFMWHGSPTERWHSIIRTGIVVGSRLNYGPCNAIFMASNSQTSLGYTRGGRQNCTKGSKLGNWVSIISILEVIKLPSGQNVTEIVDVRDPQNGGRVKKKISGVLNDGGQVVTLTMEEACIVRFIIVNLENYFDIRNNPPRLPSINEVLKASFKL